MFEKMREKKRLAAEQAAQAEAARQELIAKKQKALEIMQNGGDPPEVIGTPLILQKGEICNYSGSATRLITKEKVTGYTAGSAGVSFHVAKGVTLRAGGAKGQPIRQDVTDRFSGELFITNKRIIFQADKNGFTLPLSKLVSIKTYTDGCEYFKDSTAYLLTFSDADYCNAVLQCILSKRG